MEAEVAPIVQTLFPIQEFFKMEDLVEAHTHVEICYSKRRKMKLEILVKFTKVGPRTGALQLSTVLFLLQPGVL